MANANGFFIMVAEEEMKKALNDAESGAAPLWARLVRHIADATGQRREDVAHALQAAIGLYLIFGNMAGLLCNLIGFAYPAYASMIAIETKGKDDDTQWLTYWTIFALFSMVDFVADPIMDIVPLYWLAKCGFLIYLYLPFTRGAQQIYSNSVRPLMIVSGVIGQQPAAAEERADAAPPAQPGVSRRSASSNRGSQAEGLPGLPPVPATQQREQIPT